MRTATFKALTGDYKISDIIVKGAIGGGGDTAQKINADGTWGDLYYYFTYDGTYWLDDGWYKDEAGTPITDDDVIGVGEAFIVTAASDFTLTFAGEVVVGKPTVGVPAGSSIIGNPTPVSCKIGNIEVTGAIGGGGDTAQKINADGTWGDLYYYFTYEGTYWLDDGWYKDEAGTPVTDEDILEPSESMIFTSAAGMELKFPSVID